MQYLISKHILYADFRRFIEANKGEFVSERSLESVVRYAEREVYKIAYNDGFSPVQAVLSDGIAHGIIAGVDAIVCYPDDAEGYGRFGKKIIIVENSEE